MINIILIGNRAYRARSNRRMKQEEVCDAIGVSQATLSRFENGNYDMPIGMLDKLSVVLGVSLNYLLYGKDDSE